jgi:hypothetical protein
MGAYVEYGFLSLPLFLDSHVTPFLLSYSLLCLVLSPPETLADSTYFPGLHP